MEVFKVGKENKANNYLLKEIGALKLNWRKKTLVEAVN